MADTDNSPSKSVSIDTEALTNNGVEVKKNRRASLDDRFSFYADPTNKRLSMMSVNFQMPSNFDCQQHVQERDGGEEGLAYKVLNVLHSRTVQITLSVLLLLDVAILFTELFLLAQYPSCSTVQRDAISCCPADSSAITSTEEALDDDHERRWRWLSEEEEHGSCEFEGSLESAVPAGCDEYKWEAVHKTEEALFILTILILTIFFVELNITVMALRPNVFFRQFWYLLDYFVVTVSLTLELSFHFVSQNTAASLAGFLIVARIWRFVRIGHGILEVTNEVAHSKHQKLLAYAEDLEELLEQNNIPIPTEAGGGVRPDPNAQRDLLSKIEYDHRHHAHDHNGTGFRGLAKVTAALGVSSNKEGDIDKASSSTNNDSQAAAGGAKPEEAKIPTEITPTTTTNGDASNNNKDDSNKDTE